MPVGAPQRPGFGPWLLSAVAIGIGAQLLRFRACKACAPLSHNQGATAV
jgi:hypothetical protein